MAVEIRELIIKATITDEQPVQGPEVQSDTSNKEDIINECVEQIVQILKNKTER